MSSVSNNPQPSSATKQHLRNRAAAFASAYPDLRAMAFQTARLVLRKRTGKNLDPTQVYWHVFSGGIGSPRTLTGWEHVGKPLRSLTFLELLMQRFSPHEQSAKDELTIYGGFYSDGPDHGRYDEHNEVPLLPSDALKDFWALDFASDCKHKVDAFWREHGPDFSMFARTRLLGAAGVAFSRKQLSARDFHTLHAAMTGSVDPELAAVEHALDEQSLEGVEVRLLQLCGQDSRSILRISSPDGRQILYSANANNPFSCFDSERRLYEWVQEQVAVPMARKALIAQFSRDQKTQKSLDKHFHKLAGHPWAADQKLMGSSRHLGAEAVFAQLRQVARREMKEDIHHQLTSNATLRKQMWISYLGAFIQIAGGVAPLAWPLTLTMVGAGIASVGLNIDQAAHGRTHQIRKAGVLGAIVNSVYLFLNLPLLASIGGARSAVPAISDAVQEGPASVIALEGSEVLDDIPVSVEQGRNRGIHFLENGETWITLGKRPYRVRFLEDLNAWAIVDPRNPFAFSGARAVRFNAQEQWELLPQPGLIGGSPMDPAQAVDAAGSSTQRPYPTVSSEFWDIYMQFDPAKETELSNLGNKRQEDVLAIYTMDSDEQVQSDSEAEDVVYDASGEKHRVFKTAEGEYFGGAIMQYTHDEKLFNGVLRERRVMDAVTRREIEHLGDDLDELHFNNDVTLYRGGSGHRGTSGETFREGRLKAGDVLVNTDFTSFTENPYIARVFASSQGGGSSGQYDAATQFTFDDTSVVFEIPAAHYMDATPISLLSVSFDEVESLFAPGRYFQIQSVEEVVGKAYKFMNVKMQQIPRQQVTGPAYDMRTGVLFDRQLLAQKLGPQAQGFMNRYFPLDV